MPTPTHLSFNDLENIKVTPLVCAMWLLGFTPEKLSISSKKNIISLKSIFQEKKNVKIYSNPNLYFVVDLLVPVKWSNEMKSIFTE